jgi:O-antigen biosynthesis protein
VNLGPDFAAKVDVIVPVYNQAAYVGALLQSLFADNNVIPSEIIVIDDCSTDKSTIDVLQLYERKGAITLLKNEENVGFTRTVNRGMACHRDRDVVLLNSDTLVHGDWLDRMAACAYSAPNIATVNPLTNQYGSHVSCYPGLAQKFDGNLELSGQGLSEICARFNDRSYVDVHTTVGFCMYIRRQSLNCIGYFDAKKFPIGYGEESDFCYRARKVGWRHCVAGDVYVEHFHSKSFGTRANKLKEQMISVFSQLHPELADCDRRFARQDPVRPLRQQLDFGRLKRLLGGANEIRVVASGQGDDNSVGVCLVLDVVNRNIAFGSVLGSESLPNIGTFKLPKDVVSLNRALRMLTVDRLMFEDQTVLKKFGSLLAGQPYEVPVAAKIQMIPSARRVAQGPGGSP